MHGVLNSGFGVRADPFTGNPARHEGLDISTARSEPVLATADGVVLHSGWAGEYGKAIEIQHGDRYETLYGHLEQTLVTAGQHVQRGDRVGLVGSTGRSTAPHLHYEVRVDGHAVNPLEYVLETASGEPEAVDRASSVRLSCRASTPRLPRHPNPK